ncbi:LysR family transcriptional regulator [Cryptosporangium sp. NPDC048952]|uniref:LysR family transcriptional regulator n=1 Tax=Cryptosporangium sp. NPDC048952 TaxID=3363961 RepID=UPI00371E7DD9
MELRQLRTFLAIVRTGTVTDAATALGLASSSVSAQLRALETSLGVVLFVRTARGMRLTDAGERLVDRSHRLLDQADQLVADVRGQGRALRLGALETIAATHGPGVVQRLRSRRPGAPVELRSAVDRQELLDDVVAARLDAALVLDTGDAVGDLGFPVPPAPLTFLDVDTVPLALVAAPGDHADALLVNVPRCSFRLAAAALFGNERPTIAAGGVAVMRAWAEQGLGIALLPEFAVADSLAAGTLTRLDVPAPDLALRLIWRADRESLPGLRDLLYAASV